MLVELHIHQNAVDRWYIELDTTFVGARKFNAFNMLDALEGAFERYLDVLPAEKLALQGIKDKEAARTAMADCMRRIRGEHDHRADNMAKARAAKAAKRALSGLEEEVLT